MRKWFIRRKLGRLIKEHQHTRQCLLYAREQYPILSSHDQEDLWCQATWHYRYADRLGNILNNYK